MTRSRYIQAVRTYPKPRFFAGTYGWKLDLCVLVFAILSVFGWLQAPKAWAICPEPPETGQGTRKGLSKRNFIKSLRHEIFLFGGVYANDIMGSAPLAGLSYTFHINEDFALETTFAYTKFSSSVTKPVKNYTGYSVLDSHDARIYAGDLVWHPIHGKMMFLRSFIPHFDLYFSAGAGITDSRISKGLTYNFGLGAKIFLTSWLSIRMDVRDHVYIQEVLSSDAVTNNISFILGVGLWIPFSV